MVYRTRLLVVIDPQRAFVDPAGSLARTYGFDELQPSVEVLDRLRQYLTSHRSEEPTVFVRSEYCLGQFSGGKLDHPLSKLCVPGCNVDCEWADGIETSAVDEIVTKHQPDAWESEAFRDLVFRWTRNGVCQVVFVGFQFTTCVAASAESTWKAIRGQGVQVAVFEQLSGVRASSYVSNGNGRSRVAATRQRLQAAGICLPSFDDLAMS
ncbi:MAG: isochorismatase family protein [Planctomycetaceae bacterium]|nr:isochorismatase family protein [Planctomycetaceae bacterium]